jgi:hypothetical protein
MMPTGPYPLWEDTSVETPLLREFRADHQRITGTLQRLQRAIRQADLPLVRTILAGADPLFGAHFKFEECHLYPALTRFIGAGGVREMVREHDTVFQEVGKLLGLAQRAAWSEPEQAEALESFGRLGEHPEHCDSLSRFIEQLPLSQQDSLLGNMEAIRQERPGFSAYAIERRTGAVRTHETEDS